MPLKTPQHYGQWPIHALLPHQPRSQGGPQSSMVHHKFTTVSALTMAELSRSQQAMTHESPILDGGPENRRPLRLLFRHATCLQLIPAGRLHILIL